MKQIYHKNHMARVGDLFPEYESYSWIKGEGNIKEVYGKRNKCGVARGIFHSFMVMIMDDIVSGDMFKFPAYDAMMYIEEIPRNVQETLKDDGKLEGFEKAMVDRVYAPTYRFKSTNGDRHKFRVIFDKERYYTMLRNVHNGKYYSKNVAIW